MAKVSPNINNFNAGEFSPLMAGRTDYKFYQNACKRLLNFIPTPQGPLRRRKGTQFVSEVKDSANRTWLRKFEFSRDEAYMLEFGDLYIRFYFNHGLVMSGGLPVEVVTPYSAADLMDADGSFSLRFVQSADVVYICHESYPVQKLVRTGPSTFTLEAVVFTGGPYKDIPAVSNQKYAIVASAATGNITLQSSTSLGFPGLFEADDVGRIIYIKSEFDEGRKWEPGKTIVIGDKRHSDGKLYEATSAGTTGTVKPIHTSGTVRDGDPGVIWKPIPLHGRAEITSYISATQVNATVLDDLCYTANVFPTRLWAFEAWSDKDGWPTDVTFFKERLVFARKSDGRYWMSVAADFENFSREDPSGVQTAEMSVVGQISSDRVNQIQWIAPSDVALIIGTLGDEHVITTVTSSEPFGPTNAQSRKQTDYGSKRIPIERIGNDVVFVQKSGRKVRAMSQVESVNDRWDSDDLTTRAEHITKSQLIDIAYQQEPDSSLWIVRSDGAIVGCTFIRSQEILGWHPHDVGGFVEAIDVMPSPDGGSDELWMVVRRFIDGAYRRYVEFMERPYERGDNYYDVGFVDSHLRLGHPAGAITIPAGIAGATVTCTVSGGTPFVVGDVGKFIVHRESFINDNGITIWTEYRDEISAYNSNSSVDVILGKETAGSVTPQDSWGMTATTVSGLDHLEGETVQILADGMQHPDKVVSAGAVTLEYPAAFVVVGKKFKSIVTPMPFDQGGDDGTAMGKTSRTSKVTIRFDESSGCQYGHNLMSQMDEVIARSADDPMDSPPQLFTGDVTVPWPEGYESPPLITIMQDKPLPATLVSIMPITTVYSNR